MRMIKEKDVPASVKVRTPVREVDEPVDPLAAILEKLTMLVERAPTEVARQEPAVVDLTPVVEAIHAITPRKETARATKWVFTIARDRDGFFKTITATHT